MKPLLISSGEPAGIGPDLCLALAPYDLPIVILGDINVLQARAQELNVTPNFYPYAQGSPIKTKPGFLTVYHVPCPNPVISGQLNPNNGPYVYELLKRSATLCGRHEFAALVTAPVHKAIINESGIAFTGHTEFFSDFFQAQTVVMMLACDEMKVALVTTHLPLRQVPETINQSLIIQVITQLHQSLVYEFGISNPIIKVAGLNPHAGESGYLGREEIDVITPALNYLIQRGIDVRGPMPADTMFLEEHHKKADAFVAMYHDQGLPVLKYAGFHHAVNVTLGLPIIRTSVDHGTALELAGKNKANTGSMLAAVKMAMDMALTRNEQCLLSV